MIYKKLVLITLVGILIGASSVSTQEQTSKKETNATTSTTPSLIECHNVKENLTCPDEKIKYTLFNRGLPYDGIQISVLANGSNSHDFKSLFNPKAPVKVIIHGIILDIMTPSLVAIKDEYLNKSDYNVLFLDYEYYAGFGCYIQSLASIDHVGNCIAQLLFRIREIGHTNIHLITYSLGAHVANYVAQSMHPYKLPRITALDPPQAFMETRPESQKLDPSDAEFVDVFYTSAIGFGWGVNCGHAGFYFNGGIIQPGCVLGLCSHTRAVDYFSESIRSKKGFHGELCSSYWAYINGNCDSTYVLAGEDCVNSARGMYFVSTKGEPPYAKGSPAPKSKR